MNLGPPISVPGGGRAPSAPPAVGGASSSTSMFEISQGSVELNNASQLVVSLPPVVDLARRIRPGAPIAIELDKLSLFAQFTSPATFSQEWRVHYTAFGPATSSSAALEYGVELASRVQTTVGLYTRPYVDLTGWRYPPFGGRMYLEWFTATPRTFNWTVWALTLSPWRS